VVSADPAPGCAMRPAAVERWHASHAAAVSAMSAASLPRLHVTGLPHQRAHSCCMVDLRCRFPILATPDRALALPPQAKPSMAHLSADEAKQLTERIQNAGTEVVEAKVPCQTLLQSDYEGVYGRA